MSKKEIKREFKNVTTKTQLTQKKTVTEKMSKNKLYDIQENSKKEVSPSLLVIIINVNELNCQIQGRNWKNRRRKL